MYFAFTSLTTVGLGDLAPKSDSERIIGSAMIFCGVVLFAYILAIFTGLLSDY